MDEQKRNCIVKVEKLTKSFEELKLIRDISLSVFENESYTIIGPSGCGKTTLLKIIAGIVEPDSGSVNIFDKNLVDLDVKERYGLNTQLGFLFQNYALFDSLSVLDNVIFYLDNHTDMEFKVMKDKAEFLLSLVGLENTSHKFPSELSGGMKKRVGIVRAIIHKPKILFLDEPVAGLDPVSSDSTIQIIHKLKDKFNLTLVNISNELDFTKKLSDRIGIMYEGRIYHSDTSENIFNSKDKLIRQFILGLKTGPIKY